MYKINFNHLYYFLTIAKEGSIVKASKKLHMTQPALSHQLKMLEEDLGKKLFDRVGRRLVLNEDGKHIKTHAQKIFRQSEEMIRTLNTNAVQVIKIVRVGTVPWISESHIYQFLKPLILSHHIQVQVFQKDLASLIKDVLNEHLDVIICNSPYSGRSKKLQGHYLKSDKIVCVSATKEGFQGRFPKSLNGSKVINYSEACQMRDNIDDFIKSHQLNVQTIGEFSDTSLIQVVVEQTGAIGFLPESLVKQSLKDRKLFRLGEIKQYNFSLWAITRKSYNKDGLLASLLSRYKK